MPQSYEPVVSFSYDEEEEQAAREWALRNPDGTLSQFHVFQLQQIENRQRQRQMDANVVASERRALMAEAQSLVDEETKEESEASFTKRWLWARQTKKLAPASDS